MLEGHEGSVWTVLAYDRKTIITGELCRPDLKYYSWTDTRYGQAAQTSS